MNKASSMGVSFEELTFCFFEQEESKKMHPAPAKKALLGIERL